MRNRSLALSLAASLGFLAAGCGGGGGSSKQGPVHIQSDHFTVPAGEEMTICQVIHLNNDEAIDFNRVSSRLVEGSHHMILYRHADIPGAGAPPPEGIGECNMTSPRLYVYGSQQQENENRLPEGIGATLGENTVFILEIHIANASMEELDAWGEVTLYPAEEGSIEQYSGVMFYVNGDFEIPAGAGYNGAPQHTDGAVCPIPRDVNIYRMGSHAHKRLTRSEGWLDDAQGAEINKIYKNEDWHAPVIRDFTDPVLSVTANQNVRFECTWTNETENVIDFGESVDDEMCIVVMGYYPRIDDGPLGLDGNVFCYNDQIYY